LKISIARLRRDDLTRQFRYYLVALDQPVLAVRFKKAVWETATLLKRWPHIAPIYESRNSEYPSLRSWPAKGFEATRLYFRLQPEGIFVIRILHGKQNVRKILSRHKP